MSNLLEICTEALEDIGSMSIPAYLFGNTDDTAKQLIAIAKKVGRELARDHDFQQLLSIATVNTVASTASYALEADFDRPVPLTMWDTTTNRAMVSGVNSQRWASITNSAVQTGVVHYARLRGNSIYVTPIPSSVWSFNYEYYSKYYCTNSAGTSQSEWTDDTDLPRLPADLFIAGIRFYFMKANGLAYTDAEYEYNKIIERRIAASNPAGAIDLAAGVVEPGPYRPCLNIPDGGLTDA